MLGRAMMEVEMRAMQARRRVTRATIVVEITMAGEEMMLQLAVLLVDGVTVIRPILLRLIPILDGAIPVSQPLTVGENGREMKITEWNAVATGVRIIHLAAPK